MPQLLLANREKRVSEYLQHLLTRWQLGDTWQAHNVSWTELKTTVKDAAYTKKGAEVVEIGTTWVNEFVAMNAVRPFTEAEISRIQETNKIPAVFWKTMSLDEGRQIWSIPWTADVRVIYYWSDLLEEAGVDPDTAFQNLECFEAALERLQAHGIESPWTAITTQHMITVQHIAMWIWARGGDFMSSDGQRLLFMETPALEGIHSYFNLNRFIAQVDGFLDDGQANDLFFQRKAACTVAGAWLFQQPPVIDLPSDIRKRLKIAVPPAPSFVGGSSLMVMRHLLPRYDESAMELITRLTSEEFFLEDGPMAGYHLPASADMLLKPPFSQDSNMQVFSKALSLGRTPPATIQWGMVEDELMKAFGKIWVRMKCQPNESLYETINRYLEPLANRLNRTMKV